MGRGGGGFWRWAIPKFSSLKGGGGGIPKVEERKRFFTGKCTGLMEHSRENWRGGGGHAKVFQR